MDVFSVCECLWQRVKRGSYYFFMLMFFCLLDMAVGQHPNWFILSDDVDCMVCMFWARAQYEEICEWLIW